MIFHSIKNVMDVIQLENCIIHFVIMILFREHFEPLAIDIVLHVSNRPQ